MIPDSYFGIHQFGQNGILQPLDERVVLMPD